MVRKDLVTSRRETRVMVLQVLCESDIVAHEATSVLHRTMTEHDIASKALEFATYLVSNVLVNRDELDKIIIAYAPDWPLSQMAVVDKNILRMAIAEIEWGVDAPPGAVVNEAVELAKAFGAEGSPGFVNGVLGALLNSKNTEIEA